MIAEHALNSKASILAQMIWRVPSPMVSRVPTCLACGPTGEQGWLRVI